MKVALVAKAENGITGLSRYVSSLHDGLCRIGQADAQIVTPPPLQMLGALRWLARAAGVDAGTFFASYPLRGPAVRSQVYHLTSQTLATLLLFSRLRPAVVTVHDIIPSLVAGDRSLDTRRHSVDRLFYGLAMSGLRRADALIAISEFTKRTLIETLGLPPERIHVVHRAVDREVFAPRSVPQSFRDRYGLREDHRYVLYVGSEDPRKNVAGLIRSFAIVRRQIPAARLIKAGPAHFVAARERHLALVEELELGDDVRFIDRVPDEDLPLLYNATDAFVLPSYYEGFGLPALEAMSCGQPIVASNRASLPEVVGAGGSLVDPDDTEAMASQISALLADPDRRAEASRAALDQSRRFSPEHQASETATVYRDVM